MNNSIKAEIEIFVFHDDIISTSAGGPGEWDENE